MSVDADDVHCAMVNRPQPGSVDGSKCRQNGIVLGCSGDFVGRLSNGPQRDYYGFLWWLIGDTK